MTPSIDRSRAERAAWACVITFFTFGFAVASWLSRLPAVRDALDLQPTDLGTMLLVGSLGSLVALPSSGPLVGRIGARATARTGATLWAIALVGVALSVHAVSRSSLTACLVLLNCGMSLWAATMNIEGGLVEASLRRILLDKLHAMFSIGTVSGALVGAALAHAHVDVTVHLIGTAVLGCAVVWVVSHFFLSEEEVRTFSVGATESSEERVKGRTRQAWGERRTVLIAVMVLSAGLLEGSANDWLALSMVDGYGYTAAQGSVILSLFLATMAAVRLSSTRLHRRFSADGLLRTLLVLACVGLVFVAFSPWRWLALVGVLLWAMGAALVFPTGASALSTNPSMTAARVSVLSTVNYGAFLIGPPVLGVVAEHVGYHRAMVVLIIPITVGILLTKQVATPEGSTPAK
ncbi:MFS transporter [Actinomyces provencensis]|uniref:MFS transporter n=1 Tax=Actinomyces provencensis TaxID=1720198 RepID=UPI00096A711E|nr:MFS transporter [Actinomyces provencensis]